jgi:hypothetical protein
MNSVYPDSISVIMSGLDICIFCLEGVDQNQPLLYNVKCRCNFCFHASCYDRYDRKTICPMCRVNVGELFSVVSVYPQPRATVPIAHERTPIRSSTHVPTRVTIPARTTNVISPISSDIIGAMMILLVVVVVVIIIVVM